MSVYISLRIKAACRRIAAEFTRRREEEASRRAAESKRLREEATPHKKEDARGKVCHRADQPWETAESFLRVAIYSFGLACMRWNDAWVEQVLVELLTSATRKPDHAPITEQFFHALIVGVEGYIPEEKRLSRNARDLIPRQLHFAARCAIPVEYLLGFITQTNRLLGSDDVKAKTQDLPFNNFYRTINKNYGSKKAVDSPCLAAEVDPVTEARARRRARSASAKRSSAAPQTGKLAGTKRFKLGAAGRRRRVVNAQAQEDTTGDDTGVMPPDDGLT